MIPRLVLCSLALLPFCVLVPAPEERQDLLLADFEGDDWGEWKATGDAFGKGPSRGTLADQQPVSGFLGKGLANSYHGGDKSTGTLTSPEFKIERRYINFLIGGGNHPGKTCVNLVVGEKIVRTATGTASTPADDEHLSWHTWEVSDLDGKKARIQIVDNDTGAWGHINVDHIVQSDHRKMVEYANEALSHAMASVKGAAARAQADPNRPIYHVLPPALWCNDPNGPLFFKGYYHVFYQHNPCGDRWEHMHWGHVRSKDLIHWEHQPIALWPSSDTGEDHCFSGCAAVNDKGQPVLIYTSIGSKRPPEQWAAVGDDDLVTWKKHPANPLLAESVHGDLKIADWRDPFVFKEDGKWYMVCGGHREGKNGSIQLYTSDDLDKWRFLGVAFEGEEDNWECPNFFKLGKKWVLIYSPHGLVRYYTGTFDLKTYKFKPQHHGTLDYGSNFYAPNCLEDGDQRRILWGWIKDFPSGKGWNGCLTLPRVLTVADDGRLLQQPAPELKKLRGTRLELVTDLKLNDSAQVLGKTRGDALEILAQIEPGDARSCGLKVRRSKDGKQAATISYDGKQLDVAGAKAPLTLPAEQRTLILHCFFDKSVLEVYAGDGVCITKVISPGEECLGVEVFAQGGTARVASLEAWPMETIWPK
jgi:sucrose-6-phosphate hydrolase SacC (GH32 family)